MNMPDAALTSAMRQISTTMGLAVTVVNPGVLRGDDARDVLSGLPDEAMALLAAGEPFVEFENDPLLLSISREIVNAIIRATAGQGHRGLWAAFFDPDGAVEVVLPRSGATRVHGAGPCLA